MTSLFFATICIIVIFVSALVGVLLPLIVLPVTTRVTKIGNAFASGFLISAAIVHLLPDAHRIMAHAMKKYDVDINSSRAFPYDGLATLIGATLVFLVDFALRSRHSNSNIDNQVTRSSSTSSNDIASATVSSPLVQYPWKRFTYTSPTVRQSDVEIPTSDQVADSENRSTQSATPSVDKSTVAVVLAMSLSFHSIMEGVSLGATFNTNEFSIIAIAILAHKFFAALALGTALSTAHSLRWAIFIGVTFALATPIGAILGMLIVTTAAVESSIVSAWLTCISAGVFMYVGFVDLLAEEVCNSHDDPYPQDRMVRALSFVFAACAMSFVTIWT